MNASPQTRKESAALPVTSAAGWFGWISRSKQLLSAHSTTLLRLACAALFLGRSWQHLFVGTPYRPILFSQPMMEGLVLRFFGMDWTTWATSVAVESNINLATRVIGVVLALCALAALFANARNIWPRVLLCIGSLILAVIAFAVYRDKLLRIGELFELACAVTAPIALLLATRAKPVGDRLLGRCLAVAIAATFGAHGLYAVGYYPRPGDWVTMVMAILGLSEPAAHNLLVIAGILDFAIVVGVMTPGLRAIAAAYAFIWGLLTACARVAAHVSFENIHESGRFWIPETIIRLPNALLPLVLLGLLARLASSARADAHRTLSARNAR